MTLIEVARKLLHWRSDTAQTAVEMLNGLRAADWDYLAQIAGHSVYRLRSGDREAWDRAGRAERIAALQQAAAELVDASAAGTEGEL